MKSILIKRIILTIVFVFFYFVINCQNQNTLKYDNLNRLSQITYANGTVVNYTFDELGNRTAKTLKTASVTVAATATPVAGGTTTGTGSYTVGQSCILAATATTGYSFVNWTENGVAVSTSASYVFTVAGARTLVANFVLNSVDYSVSSTSSPTAGGTITGNSTYKGGTLCTLTATANTGYTFLNWTESGVQVSTLASYAFTVGGNRTLVANFTQNPLNYTVAASSSLIAGGSVIGGGTYQSGQACTLIATPIAGNTFVNWTENGTEVSTSLSYIFTVNGNRTLVANFIPDAINNAIIASTNPTGGGTIVGSGIFLNGQSCTLIATENAGYTFVNWTENGTEVSISANYTFTVTGNRTLVANFLQNAIYYSINASSNPQTAGLVLGSGSFISGTNQSVSGVSRPGYYFVNWDEDGINVSNYATYSFILDRNRTLVANFSTTPSFILSSAMSFETNTLTIGKSYIFSTEVMNITNINMKNIAFFLKNAAGTILSWAKSITAGQSVILTGTWTPSTIGSQLITLYYKSILGPPGQIYVVSANGNSNPISIDVIMEPTGLNENQIQKTSLHLYPNPANTYLRISTQEVLHRLEVCDISGRVIQYETVNSETYSLNVGHLAKGVYLIKGFTDNGVVTSRFIKE